MNIQSILEKYSDTLTPAEGQLVQILSAKPMETAFLSATKLAELAGVHPATAVRLAKKLGFHGYPEMREVLQADVVHRSNSAERIKRRLARADAHDLLSDLIESEIASLRELPNHVNQAQIDLAAKALIRASRVFVFAQGHAIALAELLDRRLRRSGLSTVLLKSQGRDLIERLLTIDRRDIIFAFALHIRPHGLSLVLKEAASVGAGSILLSDSLTLGHLPREKPTILLVAPRGETSEYQTLTVPMAICNALILDLARLDEERSLKTLETLDRLTESIEHEQGIDLHPSHS
jgi:DNA-binding MurR/RpiR family transcriptional regulator